MISAPPSVRIVVVIALVVAAISAMNIVYQVARKPTELFFPVP